MGTTSVLSMGVHMCKDVYYSTLESWWICTGIRVLNFVHTWRAIHLWELFKLSICVQRHIPLYRFWVSYPSSIKFACRTRESSTVSFWRTEAGNTDPSIRLRWVEKKKISSLFALVPNVQKNFPISVTEDSAMKYIFPRMHNAMSWFLGIPSASNGVWALSNHFW